MLRTTAAIAAGKLTQAVAKRRGGGSALPGLVAERLDPKILGRTLASLPRGIVVVSGTNGKTTTTRMLVALIRAHGIRVFTNPTGSNFTRGVISALLGEIGLRGRPVAEMAILELDEAHALKFADAVSPTHALLLNVARDQLDRFAEIDHTAKLLAQLAARTTAGVVLNRDDSLVARSADGVRPGVRVTYFGVDESIADRLPELMEQDTRTDDAYVVPPPGEDDVLLRPRDERSFDLVIGADGDDGGGPAIGPIELKQRGLAAMMNATAATAMARHLLGARFDPDIAASALGAVTAPFGRGEVIDADGAPLELVLDVSFASLRAGGVALTSGQRAYDMALRLQYDEVPVGRVEPDLERALAQFLAERAGQPARIFCTYTAMMTLRRDLAARYHLAAFGQEA